MSHLRRVFSDVVGAFLMMALLYVSVGILLGLAMMGAWAFTRGEQGWDYYLLPSHAHLMLIGWVSMVIFGVGYRIFPSFFGRRLHSTRMAWGHWWLANAGIIGMAGFFFLNRIDEGRWSIALGVSGLVEAAGMAMFVYNMVRTVSAPPPMF